MASRPPELRPSPLVWSNTTGHKPLPGRLHVKSHHPVTSQSSLSVPYSDWLTRLGWARRRLALREGEKGPYTPASDDTVAWDHEKGER